MTGTERQQTPTTGSGTMAGARLDFDLDPSICTVLDGAWWPRSRDSATELVDLVNALDARGVRLSLIMLNPGAWLGRPRRLAVAGRTVRIGWFADLDAAVLIATTESRRRIDLLVSIVDTPPHSALAALMVADDHHDEPSTEVILAALLRSAPTRVTPREFNDGRRTARRGEGEGHHGRQIPPQDEQQEAGKDAEGETRGEEGQDRGETGVADPTDGPLTRTLPCLAVIGFGTAAPQQPLQSMGERQPGG
jgi:Family of unknown function (DUF5994)